MESPEPGGATVAEFGPVRHTAISCLNNPHVRGYPSFLNPVQLQITHYSFRLHS